jgi:hypothetical protein
VEESPITTWLEAVDKLDVEAATAMFSADAHLLTADGRRAAGIDAVRDLLADYLSVLRSTSHRVTAQWHEDNVWIAEVEANYELRDYLELKALPRAFFIREGPRGISQMHVYGAHEHSLDERASDEGGMWIGERWIPPL